MTTNTFTVGGHEWTILFTVGLSRRLRKIGVELSNAVNLSNMFLLHTNRDKQVDALWECIASQANKLGVTQEDFTDSLGGDELEAGFLAMVAAFIQYSAPDVRPAMREAVAEYYREVKRASDAFIAEMNATTPEPAAV